MDIAEPPPDRTGSPTEPTARSMVVEDRYRLDELIGHGGMGDVYRGEDLRLGRPVAVKVFRPGSDVPVEDLRWRSEGRLLASLSHPGLVAVFDAGTDAPGTAAQRSYLVMELVTGTTLARRINDGPLDPAEVGEIGAQLASALAYVHAQGVVHRDVKPANVLIAAAAAGHDAHITARLSDFGIARLLEDARITTDGTTLGTANYLSPEQATGAHVGAPTDIYSLGLVLLEALTGAMAYPGHGVAAAAARLHRPPAIPDNLPTGWAALLAAMTSSDPDARPDAAQVATQLRALAGPVPLASAPTTVLAGATEATATPVTATQVMGLEPAGPSPTLVLPPALAASMPWARRRMAMIAIAAVCLIGLVGLAIALNSGGSGKPHTGGTSALSSPTPTPTRTLKTTQPPAAPTTPQQAITALRAAILSGVNAGTITPATAQDLNKRLDDLTQTLAEPSKGKGHDPKPRTNAAAQQVADLAKHINDLSQNGQLSAAGLQLIAGPLAALERLISATP